MTPAQQHAMFGVDKHECKAMRSLVKAGKTKREIAFMLERGEDTVIEHTERRCHHE